MKYLASISFLIFLIGSIYSQETIPGSCGNGIDDDGDGLIDCFDPDCSGQPECDGFFFGQTDSCTFGPSLPMTMQEDWRSGDTTYFSTQTPIAGDIDNDGVVEIIVFSRKMATTYGVIPGDSIFILDGVTGAVESSFQLARHVSGSHGAAIAIGDIDGDGFGEIIISVGTSSLFPLPSEPPGFECREHDGTLKWTSTFPIPFAHTPALADFNGDGIPELYSGATVFNALTGAFIGDTPLTPGVGLGLLYHGLSVGIIMPFSTAADVLPTGFCADCAGLELIAGNVVYSVNVGTGAITAQVTAGGSKTDGYTAIADVDLDGDLDAVVTANFAPGYDVEVYAWDLQTPTILANSGLFSSPTFAQGGVPNVGNFDLDPQLEVGFVHEDNYVVLDDYSTGFAVLWSQPVADESAFTSSILFDFQGDGRVEVVYQDENNLYVFDGLTGTALITYPCYGGTTNNHAIVVDVDGDDQAEIVCNCSDYTAINGSPNRRLGYTVAFGAQINPWINARKVWNQPSYFITNINDDLSIPTTQQLHHLTPGGTLNAFNMQQTDLTISGTPSFGASDATIVIDSLVMDACGGSPFLIDVYFTVTNLTGPKVFASGTEISLYNGDPEAPGATFIAQTTTSSSIGPGGSVSMMLSIPDQGGSFPLYIVVNDAAISSPIFFPNTGVPECDYTNNIDMITVDNCVILPVGLLYFDGFSTNGKVELYWETSSELNSDYFLIERSRDGTSYYPIGELNAAGFSSELRGYEYTDEEPLTSIGYYRLKQVDNDGAIAYSKVISIKYDQQVCWLMDEAAKTINFSCGSGMTFQVEIWSMDGRLIRQESVKKQININDVNQGIYLLVVDSQGRRLVSDRIFIR